MGEMLPIAEEDDHLHTMPFSGSGLTPRFHVGSARVNGMITTQIDVGANLSLDGDSARRRCNAKQQFFNLNIGGQRLKFRGEILTSLIRSQDSRLAQFANAPLNARKDMADGYAFEQDEYYFERPPDEAQILADYYMIGCVHRPTQMCAGRFHLSLVYWGIPESAVALCCAQGINVAPNNVTDVPTSAMNSARRNTTIDASFENVRFGAFRLGVWRIMEEPRSSRTAQMFAFMSMLAIFLSVSGLILGSMEEFQAGSNSTQSASDRYQPCRFGSQSRRYNQDRYVQNEMEHDGEGKKLIEVSDNDNDKEAEPIFYLVWIEYGCVAFFTIEFLVRLIVVVDRKAFLRAPLNIIDASTVIPFYAETTLALFGIQGNSLRRVAAAMLVVRVLRVLRVARIFKLARYSTGLQTIGDTFRKSARELSMLMMFLATGIVFFSTILYFLERDLPHTGFYSIPATCWWCVVTMTTVGYGDLVPETTAGKVVATAASICGIIVLAFPISMIVEKFAMAQDEVQRKVQLDEAVLAQRQVQKQNHQTKFYGGGKFGGARRRRQSMFQM